MTATATASDIDQATCPFCNLPSHAILEELQHGETKNSGRACVCHADALTAFHSLMLSHLRRDDHSEPLEVIFPQGAHAASMGRSSMAAMLRLAQSRGKEFNLRSSKQISYTMMSLDGYGPDVDLVYLHLKELKYVEIC